jgi:hypothetical protein
LWIFLVFIETLMFFLAIFIQSIFTFFGSHDLFTKWNFLGFFKQNCNVILLLLNSYDFLTKSLFFYTLFRCEFFQNWLDWFSWNILVSYSFNFCKLLFFWYIDTSFLFTSSSYFTHFRQFRFLGNN